MDKGANTGTFHPKLQVSGRASRLASRRRQRLRGVLGPHRRMRRPLALHKTPHQTPGTHKRQV